MERESKNSSDYTICPHVSDHQLKTACYKHSLVYIKPMITTNQKYTRDTQEIKWKESKSNTTECQQI